MKTFTLYFKEGDTYSKDYPNKEFAEYAGRKLAETYNLTFEKAEEVKPCEFYI